MAGRSGGWKGALPIHHTAFPSASKRSIGLPKACAKAHLDHCAGCEYAVSRLEADLAPCPQDAGHVVSDRFTFAF